MRAAYVLSWTNARSFNLVVVISLHHYYLTNRGVICSWSRSNEAGRNLRRTRRLAKQQGGTGSEQEQEGTTRAFKTLLKLARPL